MPADTNRSPRPPKHPLLAVLKPLASLQLTVVLFALSIGLVFFGTLAQQTTGLWDAVYQYFWSWVVFIDAAPSWEFAKIFFGMPKDWVAPSWLVLPWPGGKLIGGLMFVNLLAAHATRFRLTWKRAGVMVSHSGLLLLFVGEYICREFQVEQRMVVREGEAVNFTFDHRHYELAFTATNPDGSQRVAVVPEVKLRRALASGATVSHEALPCDVSVSAFYTNSRLLDEGEFRAARKAPPEAATAGLGRAEVAVREADITGVDQNRENVPSAYVTFRQKTGELIGTYLLSKWFSPDEYNPENRRAQTVTVAGVTYDVELRPARYYKPFSLYLKRDGFKFDKYIGTKTAKNYSSDLLVIDPERGVERPITVRMNDPLRHRGETVYQAGYDPRTERATQLQVVRNPGWLIPYIACAMVTAGLLFHFVLTLTTFLRRQAALGGREPNRAAAPAASGGWPRYVIPACVVVVGLAFLGSKLRPPANPGKLDLSVIARLPVVDGGRVKPLDTVARVYLRKISGREEFVGADGETYPAIKWLLDALGTPIRSNGEDGPAGDHRVVRIDNDQVLALLELPRREGSRYSLRELTPKLPALQAANERYEELSKGKRADEGRPTDRIDRLFESGDRDVFGGQLAETFQRANLYRTLCHRKTPLLLPPFGPLEWRSMGDMESSALREARVRELVRRGDTPDRAAMLLMRLGEELQPGKAAADRQKIQEFVEELDRDARPVMAELLAQDPVLLQAYDLLSAYRSQDQGRFDKATADFRELSASAVTAAEASRGGFEVFLNTFAPAYYVMHLYILALCVTFVGWAVMAGSPQVADHFRRAAFWLTVVAFAAHTFALVSRMYVSDRWFVFVTNLYSSAVFIGWAAVGIGLLLERTYKLGLGNALAAVLGGATAIIAHNLAASGDTLEMMQAVLDTNFWLAIHVTTVTFGYSATYAAGLVAALYLILGIFTPLFRTREVTYSVTAAGIPVRGTDLSKVLGNIIYGIVCLATLFSFFGTVSGGIWADQSWGRFWGWDPKENGAVLIVIWNCLILHARWCGLVKERGMAVLALGGNMVTTWSWFGTNQLGVGLHAYGFSKTLALGCTITWFAHLGLIAVGCLPKSVWFGFSKPPKA